MNALESVKKGMRVVKLLTVGGIETASLCVVAAVCKKRGLISLDTSHVSKASDIEADGVQTYNWAAGHAVVNYIPGCSSRIVLLEE
jgi:1-aminocyclopropane-1-carboxylate deaminase/D-cysteine desulfhydrase-like pyridoxal-dependent ACC family enzyme